MPNDPIDYLRHTYDECQFILSVISEGVEKDAFISDETLKRATVRSLEIIGESTKNIPADIKFKWDSISWKNMAGMRDRLIHDYMGINYSIVWDVVKNKIPELTAQKLNIIEEETTND